MKPKRQLLTVALALLVSWILLLSIPVATAIPGWRPQTRPPEVPFTLTPHATGEHVRSSVYFLVVVVLASVVCAVPIEFAKYAVTHTKFLPGALYGALVVQQAVTIADAIRVNAWDWWIYLLSVVHLYEIDQWTWREMHPTLIGRWPWPSAISGIAIIVFVVTLSRRRNDIGAAAVPTASQAKP